MTSRFGSLYVIFTVLCFSSALAARVARVRRHHQAQSPPRRQEEVQSFVEKPDAQSLVEETWLSQPGPLPVARPVYQQAYQQTIPVARPVAYPQAIPVARPVAYPQALPVAYAVPQEGDLVTQFTGLARRYAKDGKPWTAIDFQKWYSGSWYSEWQQSPQEQRVANDWQSYSVESFASWWPSNWQTKWDDSKEATQQRRTSDGKTYNMWDFKKWYGDPWRAQWMKSVVVPCVECRSSSSLIEETSASQGDLDTKFTGRARRYAADAKPWTAIDFQKWYPGS